MNDNVQEVQKISVRTAATFCVIVSFTWTWFIIIRLLWMLTSLLYSHLQWATQRWAAEHGRFILRGPW